VKSRQVVLEAAVMAALSSGCFLFLIEVEEVAGIDLQGAGELKDIVEADILLSALHFSDEITVDLYHLAKRFLGQVPFRAYGTQACAER
jgi:hypothetical protein